MPWAAAIIGTFVFHRYTILSGFDAVQADNGDSRYIAFMLEHWNAFAHGLVRLGSPPIFYPVQGTLGYSDALAGMGLVHIALRAMGLGVFTAMNVQLVGLTLASFAAAYWFLSRGFRLGVGSATVGASFFAFCWPRFAELVHVQMQFTFVVPLLGLLALECLRDGAGLSRAGFLFRLLGFVALLALTMATAVYLAEFSLLFIGVSTAPSLLSRTARRHYGATLRRQWPCLVAGAALAAALAWPISHVYLPVMRQSGGRSWPEVRGQLLYPVDLVWMGRENYAWGWLFARWHELVLDKWPGKRLGVGLVATLAWLGACVWAVRALRRREEAVAALVILGAAFVQLSALRFEAASLWWLFWEAMPGMRGIRTIGRIQLVAALPMGLGYGLLLERSTWPRWALALLVGAAAVEQTGMVQRYSAHDAEALAQRVADAIPPTCKAAYVVPGPDLLRPPPPIEDESQFDAGAYLRANPDIAAGWKGTAWSHYRSFGRREHRSLNPDYAKFHVAMMFFYNYTVPLAAALTGIPVVNGLSGWQPPGWDLFDVFLPEAPEKLAQWLALNHRSPADVCIVRLDMPYTSLPTIELWKD